MKKPILPLIALILVLTLTGFALAEEGNVMKAVCGEKIGTIVSGR